MEEISSLDSFHTEPETIGDGGHVGEPKNSDPTKSEGDVTSRTDEVDRLFDMPGTPVVDEAHDDEVVEPTKEDNASKLSDTIATNDEDEFDQISDGTFEIDENSRAASTGPLTATTVADSVVEPEEKPIHDDGEPKAVPALVEMECNEQEQKEDENVEKVTVDEKSLKSPQENQNIDHEETKEAKKDELIATSSTQESADFEEVDANVSASAAGGCEEADMLGESDMTLPSTNALSEKDESPQTMEVDKDNDEEAAKSEDEAERIMETEKTLPNDVEMRSLDIDADSAEPSNVKTPEQIKENESMEDDTEQDNGSKETTNVATEEKDEVDVSNSAVETTTEEISQHDLEKEKTKEDGNESTTKEASTVQQADTDKEDATTDVVEADLPEESETTAVEVADDEEPEQDDEPVENVQEPEESDVCLIPDDTETEMTDAEKEQAILARENAEKEDEQAEKESETAKEQNSEADKSKNDAADAEAQATEAGAEAAAVKVNEESSVAPGATDVPDATDEPLLEEMQSGCPTGDTGSNTKIIIAWIVATKRKCKQCGVEKLCGFRFKNPETTEAEYLCEQSCCDALLGATQGKYFIRRKKFLVEEISNDVAAAAAAAIDEQLTSNKGADVQRNATADKTFNCLQCKESKPCKYFFKQDDENFYICNDDCFNLLSAEEPDKFKLKRHSIRVRNIGATTLVSSTDTNTKKSQPPESRVVARTAAEAEAARLERVTSFNRRCADCFSEVTLGDKNLLWETMDFCNEICLGKYQRTIGASCQTCRGDVPHQALGKYCVRFGFEIRQFCCAACLNEFKKGLKTCSCCQKDISSGNEGFLAPVGDKEQFKDFCSQACMRRYDAMCNPKKKMRNDVCAVCNNDKPVRVEIMLDEKEHNFCSNPCFSAFKFVSNIVADQCGMCCKYFERKGSESFTIYTERRAKVFCSRICLNVYIIVNRKIVSCQWCKVKKYNFDMIYKQQDAQEILMCSLNCLTLYGVSINAFSRTVAKCDNCTNSATPQYHLTMSDASMRNFCTYQCVMQFQSQFARAPLTLDSSNDSTSVGQQQTQPQSAGATNTNKSSAPFPTGLPKRVKLRGNQQQPSSIQIKLPTKNNSTVKKGPQVPVISAVSSLASGETETMIGNVTVRRSRGRGRKIESPPPLPAPPVSVPTPAATTTISSGRGRPRRNVDYTHSPSPVSLSPPRTSSKRSTAAAAAAAASALAATAPTVPTPAPAPQIQIQEKITVQTETKIVTVPPYPPAVRNVQTSCKPQTVTVGFQCEPTTRTTSTQTGKDYSNKVLIPVPVPIYIPQPMYMYSAPFPVPVPIPLPIPVPIFIPTSRNSAQGILKEIKKIQDKMPADPFEAELLMMAEMVAEEKRDSDSDSEDEIKPDPGVVSLQYDNNVQQVEVANNSYGEDVLQMALKMATGEYDQPTVDLESAMTANTITNPPPGMVGHDDSMGHMSSHHMQQQQMLEAQRGSRGRKRGAITTPVAPRNNRSPVKRQRLQELDSSPQPPPQNMHPVEKPDANMCLKYTFGVNAWKQWVMTKNADLEKSSIRRRPFKTELLQMTADELNYSLCLFVKEVRKPNGTEYAPDTIYYLVLGIQQYLYENGRIDNIFTDPYYERFTDCLDEVARKFSVLYNDSQYIVTRVEEEHLWECKQLGAHSPHVLLSTLMFFNTKHFNLTTVEEHMQLSFSHIMKHWKRSAQNAKSPGTRNVLLRFYPPQAGLDANPRKKKVYEQQENEENPLRCPVRLYEFYLSKCPESVKTRNDVFYLQPERSCVPDSPVWYSTQALSQESLQKMLHRVKMVKEINIALLTS